MTYLEPSHLKPNLIIGYTTRRHLMLDLDNTTKRKVTCLAHMLMREYPKIGDCLIVKSSSGHPMPPTTYLDKTYLMLPKQRPSYHLVFDNLIGYNSIIKIAETLANLDILEENYIRVRHFRGDITLRISHVNTTEGVKPAPIPVLYLRNNYTDKHDGYISQYIQKISMARKLLATERSSDTSPEDGADSPHYNA